MVKRISVECKMNRSWLLNPENDAAYKSQQKVLRYQCPYSIIEKSQGNGGNSCNQYCRDLGKGLFFKVHLLGHLRSLDNGNTKEDNRQPHHPGQIHQRRLIVKSGDSRSDCIQNAIEEKRYQEIEPENRRSVFICNFFQTNECLPHPAVYKALCNGKEDHQHGNQPEFFGGKQTSQDNKYHSLYQLLSKSFSGCPDNTFGSLRFKRCHSFPLFAYALNKLS